MRALLLLAAIGVSACASANGPAERATETTRIVGGTAGTSSLSMTASTSASVTSVAFPIDRVWRLMPGVYDSLGIGLTVADPARRFIGNEGMKAHQKLKNVMLSQYIDCGEAQIGPSADSYDIFLSVTSTLQSVSPTETRVSTIVDAAGKPITHAQDYSRCTSKGTIETKIAAILAARRAASTK
jgi:hypothetical protein